MNNYLATTLKESFDILAPFSKKFKVDESRYLFSLALIMQCIKSNQREDTKIVDIGTGIGLLPLTLKRLGFNACGVDWYVFPEAQNDMFKVAEIEELKVIWKKNNLTIYNSNIFTNELPEALESADIIVSEAMIEHLKDPKAFLLACNRLLKPNGILLLTTPNIATLLKRLRFLLGRSPNWPVAEFFAAGEAFTGHWREYTMAELTYMCENAGFKIIKTYNKNLLTTFKGWRNWRKNLRACIMSISTLLPGTREMNYLLCQKK